MSIPTIPWFLKIPAKIVLSRLPVQYDFWRALNLFRAGQMDDPETAFAVFRMHSDAAGFATRHDYIVLELGPGDSMLTALFARVAGAARSILVDERPLANTQRDLFVRAETLMTRKGLSVPELRDAGTTEEILSKLQCSYLANGLASLRSIPNESVDFVFSNAVIEHVRKDNFGNVARELHRIMKPDGVASHWIDYRDHLQDSLNNLRFSDKVWESDLMARSGFYTNRLTAPTVLQYFEAAGFQVEIVETVLWPDGLPTPQQVMSEPFASLPEAQLMVMTNWVLLRKKKV